MPGMAACALLKGYLSGIRMSVQYCPWAWSILLITGSGAGMGKTTRMKSDSHGAQSSLAARTICRFIGDIRIRSLLHAELGKRGENSKSVQEPQNHGNNYDNIQNLFD
jgi:hypothetical protein